ncbi:MAG: DNA adenine methylase [Myxococcota bacterium]
MSAKSTRPSTAPTPSRKPPLRARSTRPEPSERPRLRLVPTDDAPLTPPPMPIHARDTPRPFVKWVGGKTQLLSALFELMPQRFSAYHEAFVGGGAMFFGLTRAERLTNTKVFLSDVNQELVSTYTAIRDDVANVVRALEQHPHDRDHYYQLRATDPWCLPSSARAARLLYLNRTGFNGLYRVNRAGEFNVPFGRYDNPKICDSENLLAVSKALRNVSIEHRPFQTVLERAGRGDFVYFDPPYVPVSPTASFVGYAKGGFNTDAQEHLATVFDTLVRRGVHVLLSNSDAPWVRSRYRDHQIVRVAARRNVNSKAGERGPVAEVVVVGKPA